MNSTKKVALVTGGARRIGASIVRRLHSDGYAVAIHCHQSKQQANALAAELNALRAGSAMVLSADLLVVKDLSALVANVITEWGQLDLLVNNASTFYPTTVGEITEEHWDDLLGSNLKAPLFLSQAALPALKTAKGCIVNIVDIHASRPLGEHPVYCSAKAGLAMLTRSLAKDLGPEVRVNGVAPGGILWPESGMTEAEQAKLLERVALKRQGGPEDIAGAVAWLAAADYVTGEIITVDGGRSLGW